jgi:hypothetical protein
MEAIELTESHVDGVVDVGGVVEARYNPADLFQEPHAVTVCAVGSEIWAALKVRLNDLITLTVNDQK